MSDEAILPHMKEHGSMDLLEQLRQKMALFTVVASQGHCVAVEVTVNLTAYTQGG